MTPKGKSLIWENDHVYHLLHFCDGDIILQQEIGEEEPPKRRSGKKKAGRKNKNKGGRKRQESFE